jgi:hypothetical protein
MPSLCECDVLERRRASLGGARLPRRSAESLRRQIGASAKLRERRTLALACERERTIPAIAAMIRSRCERIQRANANTAIAIAAAHASVVPNPRSTEPPNASSKPASVVPASRESKSSIAGTAIDASSIVAPAKSGALRQFGAGEDASVPWDAASKQSRRPRHATIPATTAASAATSPRES